MSSSMKRTHRIILGLSLAVIAPALIFAWKPVKYLAFHNVCEKAGGKWASNQNYCISRDCAADNSCLPSYGNNATCKDLTVGISQKEIYFQLGMPKRIDGNIYIFEGGGLEPEIRATIENNKVTRLQCGT